MAKKGKKIGKERYELKYKHEFEKLMQSKKEMPGTFLGFKLKRENVNQIWRWDSLEQVNF